MLLLGVASDDLVFDLVVDALWENAASDELVLGGVRATVDDALGVGIADAGDRLELISGSGVDVERRRAGFRCSRWRFWRLSDVEDRSNSEQKSGGKQLATKSEHRSVSLWVVAYCGRVRESAGRVK